MNVEVMTANAGTGFYPVVADNIQLKQEMRKVPSELIFTVVKTPELNVQMGDPATLKVDGVPMFYGFVFKSNRNKDGTIKYTAYDQLRYFKNKDTYIYENKTATEVIQMLANDFQLNVGDLVDTQMKIESRVEDNKELFEIIQNALDETLRNRRELFLLYDDFGKLTLKNIGDMNLSFLIDAATAEDFDYASSIDGETYNKIKLSYENEKTGKREIYIAQSTDNINRWGILQHFEEIDNPINGATKADSLLMLYNKQTRNLQIKGAFGKPEIRAGCLLPVSLNLGDVVQNTNLLITKCTHKFTQNLHQIDMALVGGEFVA